MMMTMRVLSGTTAVRAYAASLLFGVASMWLGCGAQEGQCTPFQIPSQYDDLSQLCDYLKELPERQVQEEYSKGRVTAPVNRGGRPPAGCLAGCPITNSQATQSSGMYLEGWSGKCFVDFENGQPSTARNIITPGAQERSWSRGIGGTIGFGGDVTIGESWLDRQPTLILAYTDAPPGMMGIDFNDFIDEIREVAPGFWIGQIWTKPNTGTNPFGAPIPGAWFALFQVCTADGQYPTTPAARVVSRTQPPPAPAGRFGGGSFFDTLMGMVMPGAASGGST